MNKKIKTASTNQTHKDIMNEVSKVSGDKIEGVHRSAKRHKSVVMSNIYHFEDLAQFVIKQNESETDEGEIEREKLSESLNENDLECADDKLFPKSSNKHEYAKSKSVQINSDDDIADNIYEWALNNQHLLEQIKKPKDDHKQQPSSFLKKNKLKETKEEAEENNEF
jgi:hypothetical protein